MKPTTNEKNNDETKWYVLPPPVNENDSTIIENAKQLKPIHKYLYTLILFYLYLCVGIIETGVGPPLVDLKYIFKTDINHVSIYFTVFSIGTLGGNLFGFLFDRNYLNRQVTFMILSIFPGICFALTPHSPSLLIYYTFGFVCGLNNGLSICGCTVWIIEIWKDKCHPILHIQHFCSSIGYAITPFMWKFFVIGERKEENQEINSSKINLTEINYSYNERLNRLTWPFLIIGSFLILSGIIQFLMFFFKKYHYFNPINEAEEICVGETSLTRRNSDKLLEGNISGAYKAFVVCLAALSTAFTQCIMRVQFQFAPTFFQLIPLKLDASQASMMIFIFNIFQAIGRLSAIFLSIKFHARTLLICNFTLSIFAVLVLFLSHSYAAFFIGSALFGLGLSSFMATFAAFIASYLTYDDRCSTIIQLVTGVSKIFVPVVLGAIIETHPMSLLYSELSLLLMSLICFIFILITVKTLQRKESMSIAN